MQVVSHIETLLYYIQQGIKVGEIFQISLSYMMMESVLSSATLGKTNHDISYLTPTWKKHLWQFLLSQWLSIRGLGMETPVRQREGYEFLMESFQYYYSGQHLSLINRCRIYLQVITLSDITTPSVNNILPQIWNSEQLASGMYTWPRQQRLSEKAWMLWRQCLRRTFLLEYTTLLRPLGKWYRVRRHTQSNIMLLARDRILGIRRDTSY